MEYFAMEVWSVWVRGHCRIDPPRFLAECRKRRLDQDSFVLLYFRLSTLFDLYLVLYAYFLVLYLYLVSVCLFSCTALFVSISQVIGCEDRLRNDLYCVGCGVKLYSLTHSLAMRSKLPLVFPCPVGDRAVKGILVHSEVQKGKRSSRYKTRTNLYSPRKYDNSRKIVITS